MASQYLQVDGMSAFWLDCDEPCGGSSWTNDTVSTVLYNVNKWPAQLVGAAYPSRLSEVPSPRHIFGYYNSAIF
jgi:hypothetical protein